MKLEEKTGEEGVLLKDVIDEIEEEKKDFQIINITSQTLKKMIKEKEVIENRTALTNEGTIGLVLDLKKKTIESLIALTNEGMIGLVLDLKKSLLKKEIFQTKKNTKLNYLTKSLIL